MKQLTFGLGLVAAALMVACGGKTTAPAPQTSVAPPAATAAAAAVAQPSLAGTYTGSGGGGALAQVQVLAAAFQKQNPGVVWNLTAAESDSGVQLVESKTVDIGFVSRDLTPAEASQVGQVSIGAVGTGIVVAASNPVKMLTSDQVAKIFSGQITDWSAVGGTPGPIKIFVREPVAATRTNFESYFFPNVTNPKYAPGAVQLGSIPEMVDGLTSFPGGIGMVSVTHQTLTEPKIHMVGIDGVPVTPDTLLNNTYKVRRPLAIVFDANASELKPGVKAFIDYVRGPEGQQLLRAPLVSG